MQPKAYVYTELQISVPFDQAPWRELNPILRDLPGLINKTWLSGVGNQSVGGFYAFDSIEHATRFAHEYFPGEAKRLNAAFTTRIFDASAVEEASRFLHSPYYPAQPVVA